MRKNKGILAVTSAIILLPMLAGLLLWTRLPQTMATHFGVDGLPNGFMSKPLVVFMMPLVLLALHWVCILAGKFTAGEKISPMMASLMLWIIPAVSLFVGLTVYGYALYEKLDVTSIVLTFVGAIFAVCGNYMPKITKNYTMGIRIPTTLADEDNWNRTHRFAGPVWVIGGLVLLVCGMTGLHNVWALWVPAAALVVLAALPIGYSMMLAAKKGKK